MWFQWPKHFRCFPLSASKLLETCHVVKCPIGLSCCVPFDGPVPPTIPRNIFLQPSQYFHICHLRRDDLNTPSSNPVSPNFECIKRHKLAFFPKDVFENYMRLCFNYMCLCFNYTYFSFKYICLCFNYMLLCFNYMCSCFNYMLLCFNCMCFCFNYMCLCFHYMCLCFTYM